MGNEVTDLKISEVRNDYIKIDGKSKLKVGDRIVGRLSGVSAEITSLNDNQLNSKLIFQIDKNMVG